MADYVLLAGSATINLSPVGFRKAAEDFLSCYDSFKPSRFSIVPYFLCCKTIELSFKALHLETLRQKDVKVKLGHKLGKSYAALPACFHVLSGEEIDLLKKLDEIYLPPKKGFEYMDPFDAATDFSNFPDLVNVAALARKTLELVKA